MLWQRGIEDRVEDENDIAIKYVWKMNVPRAEKKAMYKGDG